MSQTPEYIQQGFIEKSVTIPGLTPVVETVLWKHPEFTWEQLTKETIPLNSAFLAFTLVRTHRGSEIISSGPWIGIEGYPAYIWTDEQIIEYEKRRGNQFLDTLTRETRYDLTRRKHIESTLWASCDYIDALRLFDELVGSELGRLRALAFQCSPEQRRLNTIFREQTYRQIMPFHVTYRYSPNEGVTITYPRPAATPFYFTHQKNDTERGSLTLLRMMQIATTPLVRTLLHHAN